MEYITYLIDFFLNINLYLQELLMQYGTWFYVILFVIIFCETGLIVMPFLPGDSLLFAAGSLAAMSNLNIHLLAVLLVIAAVLGDAVNYWVGYYLGPKIFKKDKSLFFNKKYLDRTHAFYEKYGGKTIILARFIPIIRTFAPFVAGIGKMPYKQFSLYNISGAILWVGLIIYASYFFGGTAVVQENFSLLIIAIIVISVLPAGIEVLRAYKSSTSKKISPKNE